MPSRQLHWFDFGWELFSRWVDKQLLQLLGVMCKILGQVRELHATVARRFHDSNRNEHLPSLGLEGESRLRCKVDLKLVVRSDNGTVAGSDQYVLVTLFPGETFIVLVEEVDVVHWADRNFLLLHLAFGSLNAFDRSNQLLDLLAMLHRHLTLRYHIDAILVIKKELLTNQVVLVLDLGHLERMQECLSI